MAAMVTPFVMTAAPVPSVMMAAAPVPTAVMAMPAVLDLNRGAVLRGQGRDADSGGSGQGHCQRGNQCRADQNDTSHAGSSGSLDRDVGQVPIAIFVPRRSRRNCRIIPDMKRLPDSVVKRAERRQKLGRNIRENLAA